MNNEVKENLKNVEVWMRLLYIVIFYALYGVAKIALFVMVIFQFLSTLFTRKANARLLNFGKQLSDYIYQVVRYLSYTSDDKPYPFADWPAGESTKTAGASAPPEKKETPKPEPEPESKPDGGEETQD